MDPIRFSIREPVKIVVIVLVVLLFGIIGLFRMPYQLTPNLTVPQITVRTTWSGASPYEIEREIVEKQEDVLKGIPRLVEMESSAYDGRSYISLKFSLGTDLDDALLRVSNKLNEVRSYPEGTDRPSINATGESTSPAVWLFLEATEGNPRPVYEYRTFFDDEIKQYFERINGVADIFMGGGTEREIHVICDPDKCAVHGLTIPQVIATLKSENATVSAGKLGVGRKDFRIRTVGEFKSVDEIENVVILSTGEKRIYLSDIAVVKEGFEKRTAAVFHNGKEGLGFGIKPEPGANVLEMTDDVEETVSRLNDTILKEKQLFIRWTYDQRPYIMGSIRLVRTNILIGGVLAILILLMFLRSLRSTIVVATAIPISIIGTFFFLNFFGRTLNVISLAGISFAVGMLLDSAIVVLENIDRHRTMGKDPYGYTYEGTREVWGAILASSLTTIAVFLPVVFMEEEAGQLFQDIAIAVSCAITLSLFISISVIPTFANKLFGLTTSQKKKRETVLTRAGSRMIDIIMSAVEGAIITGKRRVATVFFLTGAAVLVTWLIIPKMEYLPQGNRNFVLNIMNPPPGISLEERTRIGDHIFSTLEPHMSKDRDDLPGIRNLFYIGHERIMLMGAMSTHEDRAGELVPLLRRVMNDIPGISGISNQAGIFQTRMGGGRTIDVDISGHDLEEIIAGASAVTQKIRDSMNDVQIRPRPSLQLLYPEISIVPDRERLAAIGMSPSDLGVNIDVLMDGRDISDFKQRGEKLIDIVLKGADEDFTTPEDLFAARIATPEATVMPISSLATMEYTAGADQIRHLERRRTVTLQVTPPATVSLEEAIDRIQNEFIPVLQGQGALESLSVSLSGEAGKLEQARQTLQWNFLLAAIIIYLLMSGLFNNFIYPLIILFTLPLAAAGGFVGLKVVNLFTDHPLDILTMLGFVILIGVVVNNAILIVHQALNNIRVYGMTPHMAVLESTRTRLRPIYMTTFTSTFGMLPLVVSPGPGSEIYRGLGSVILGGLLFSTIFVIFVIPSLLLFFLTMEKTKKVD